MALLVRGDSCGFCGSADRAGADAAAFARFARVPGNIEFVPAEPNFSGLVVKNVYHAILFGGRTNLQLKITYRTCLF